MFVLSRSKVDLGLNYMVERYFVALGFGAGFLAVEHVIGARGHLGDQLAGRANAFEWFYYSHV